jgi:hemerythrin-like domain-containing protein
VSTEETVVEGEIKPISVEDAYYILEAATSVAIIPGYGMAVAQAQHVVKELRELLEKNGAEVNFGIHPVAGRMPGHMNVLLAEADVPYDQLLEMDDINPRMETVDVAIVIGANDVVNPAAREVESSPIYGMPVINVDKARTVFVLKRSMASGFAGIENPLFYKDNTRMLFGDAKESIGGLVRELRTADSPSAAPCPAPCLPGGGGARLAAQQLLTRAISDGDHGRGQSEHHGAGRAAVRSAGHCPADLRQQHRSEAGKRPMLGALRDEHRHLASVLALLSDHLNAIERGELVNTHVIYEIMDYMVTWVDRFHHAREDVIYDYAADVDHGLREDRRKLEQEHDAMARAGRDLLHCIERWRAGEAEGTELLRQGRDYVQRSYAHMAFEEQEVFPAIDAVLTVDDWRELAADEQLRPVRDPVFGRRVSREFRNMARKLRRSLRRGVERRAVVTGSASRRCSRASRCSAWPRRTAARRRVTRCSRACARRPTSPSSQPLKAPLLCTANNTRLTPEWLERNARHLPRRGAGPAARQPRAQGPPAPAAARRPAVIRSGPHLYAPPRVVATIPVSSIRERAARRGETGMVVMTRAREGRRPR